MTDDPMCECGELKSEHYDELDPPEFMNGRAVQVDACRSFSQCACEDFVLDGGTP